LYVPFTRSETLLTIPVSPDEKRQSGLSGMLSAFPPPGLGTPTRGGTPIRPNSSWPSPYDENRELGPNSRNQQPKKRRRCCGLPCWGFFLVLLILLTIIAAAVVVPLELLVLHKPKTTSTSVSAVQTCESTTSTACQNGGTSIIDNGSCACICTNGFTGPTCTVANFTGCITTTLPDSTYNNVTLGNAIPRLISGAQANFSIPLFESVILARFNSANLTCASENALVTFDGESTRSGNALDQVSPLSSSTSSTSPSATGGAKIRRIATESLSSAAATITYSPSAIYTSDTTPSATTSAASSLESSNPDGQFLITEQVLDFARVAVLFVLQQEEIDAAVTAQGALQHVFSLEDLNNREAMNISIGGGNSVDLIDFSINLGNGSVGYLNNSTLSRRAIVRRSMHLWYAL
jgi:hypothetical protein